jgi:hypothetical protein
MGRRPVVPSPRQDGFKIVGVGVGDDVGADGGVGGDGATTWASATTTSDDNKPAAVYPATASIT